MDQLFDGLTLVRRSFNGSPSAAGDRAYPSFNASLAGPLSRRSSNITAWPDPAPLSIHLAYPVIAGAHLHYQYAVKYHRYQE